jgi:hypothetical protein
MIWVLVFPTTLTIINFELTDRLGTLSTVLRTFVPSSWRRRPDRHLHGHASACTACTACTACALAC